MGKLGGGGSKKNKFDTLRKNYSNDQQKKTIKKQKNKQERDSEKNDKRKQRLSKMKERATKIISTETEQLKKQRLAEINQITKKIRSQETEEKREQRLSDERKRTAQNILKETPQMKKRRLLIKKEHSEKRLSLETPEMKQRRLLIIKSHTSKRVSQETPEMKQRRLSIIKSHTSKRVSQETPEMKQRRLSIIKKQTVKRNSQEGPYSRWLRLANKRRKYAIQSQGQREIIKKKRVQRESVTWKEEVMNKSSLNHICASDCRYRPLSSLTKVILKGPKQTFTAQQLKLLTLTDDTKSIDGQYYVCKACKDTIKKGKIPTCNESVYKFRIKKLPEKFQTKEMELNRLEAHLLKLIIPFIRIAHLPGAAEFKVKGGMITVEADVKRSMEKILPRNQELIPVCLRRKLEYKGKVMEEIISRTKVKHYYNFFKENKPLFQDESFDDERLDQIVEDILSQANVEQHNSPDDLLHDDLLHDDNLVLQEDGNAGACNVSVEGDETVENIIDWEEINSDTVLETFNQKIDNNGTTVCDRMAENILTQEVNPTEILVLAPTEASKFVNHEAVVDIEEKCFPHLFPYGTGGYVSSYMGKGVAFSNYIKNRLNGVDRQFANDYTYVTFLFHVKEALEIKRSRVTYFRKCFKKKYTVSSIKGIDKASIERSDYGFKAFKNVRGTTPYFEAKKRELFAMIRQLGSPHIFFTKSINEVSIKELIKSLKEKDSNKKINDSEAESIPICERYRLLKKYPIDVVQHIDARFRNLIVDLKKSQSLGLYKTEDHFYRVEFQQRGSAHIHCLFWLVDDNGDSPPKLNINNTENDEDFKKYYSSIISASSENSDLTNGETNFQKHNHTFSCYKSKTGMIKIKSGEGHGKLDGQIQAEELEVPKCRHGFPKFPIPETTIVRRFPTNCNSVEFKEAKHNLDKIKKFIVRQTHSEELRVEFEKNTFTSFLEKLGMTHDQYVFALKAAVKQSFLFLTKRECCDIFTNNYNSKILKEDPSNHDIQIIDEEEGAYSVASYVAKYLSKEESGQSKLLKAVEEQSRQKGDSAELTLKKLAKVLEDTREVSMQELIFRLFGFTMCSASRKHKFIQTKPPEKRDGLLKANIDKLADGDDVFCNNIIDYYQCRPDCLQNITLAAFAADYEYEKCSSTGKKQQHIDSDQIQEDDSAENIENVDHKNQLLLKNNMGILKRRRKRAIVRYFKGNNYDNEETQIRTIMLLFHPFSNEIAEVHEHPNILKKYNNFKFYIDQNQREFEKNPDFMDCLEHLDNNNNSSIENEENETQFLEEETTTAAELEEFMRKQGKIYDGGHIRLEEKLDLTNRINTLNLEQRKIFDEMMDIESGEQFFLYLYGKAGTGKTYLLNTIIPALEFKCLREGIDLQKPLILVLSPTATAAKQLKYGDTIHGGLEINGFENLEKQLKFAADSRLASSLIQVVNLVIDEISMVGSNFLWKIHERLKSLLGNCDGYFGGLNVIATGDFHQLPPVGDNWVFKNTSISGRCNSTATNLWKVKFKLYKLTEHVRSGGDETYSWLQENIASGIVTEEMIPYLESRVQQCDTEFDNRWYRDGRQVMITPTHEVKDEFNSLLLSKLEGHEYVLDAVDKPSVKNPTLPDLSKLHEGKTNHLRTTICVKLQSPIKITKNISKKDQLVNGTFGYVIDVDEENSIVWCKFDGNVGCKTRHTCKHKHPQYKDAVPILRIKEKVKVKVPVNGKTYYFQRTQFPLVSAYAITCHASQGITKERVIIDYPTNQKRHGLFFVPFSRARTLNGVFLKNFSINHIYCDPDVIKELERLESKALYKFRNIYLYDDYFYNVITGQPCSDIKVSYLNINGLLHSNHFQCLKSDKNLMSTDILCIAETKLCGNTSSELVKLPGFDIVKRIDHTDGCEAMGMLIYKRQTLSPFQIYTNEDVMFQTLVCDMTSGVICFVYVNPRINAAGRQQFSNYLNTFSVQTKFIAIIGDFNIRNEVGMGENPVLTDTCSKLGVVSTFSKETHDHKGQLDYVLVKKYVQFRYLAGCFKNLYSDHKSVFIRFSLEENVQTLPEKEQAIDNVIPITALGEQSVPMKSPRANPCGACGAKVDSNSIRCNVCQYWIHNRCSGLPNTVLLTEELGKTFICCLCKYASNTTDGPSTSKNILSKVDVPSNSKNMSGHIMTGFENKSGSNDCWLNCVMRLLAHILKDDENSDVHSQTHSQTEQELNMKSAFVKYIKETIVPNRHKSLWFQDETIEVVGEHNKCSIKQLFSNITQNIDFNQPHQQDVADAIISIVNTVKCIKNQIEYFFEYSSLCTDCNVETATAEHGDTMLKVAVPSGSKRFNMEEAISDMLNSSEKVEKRCVTPGCLSNECNQKLIIKPEPPLFFMVQLKFFDNDENKKKNHCYPAHQIELDINGEKIKYNLEMIVEHLGRELNSGHYVSYIKKEGKWCFANDLVTTYIDEIRLPKQPYISLYKKVI